jgi:hypothetical protein
MVGQLTFSHIFLTVAGDLLKVMEEIITEGKLKLNINSTFIALIWKSNCPSSFDDFKPIALCIFLYKIHSKIIDEAQATSL